MNRIALCLLALACATPAVAGEMYRWIDKTGQVHYSDQPPPPGVGQATRMGPPGQPAAPETAPARPQVVLYSANCGATCDQAVGYLRQRGVPFVLKGIDQDAAYAAELYKRTGAYQVPVLYVGESVQRGYAAVIWDRMLEMAGYETTPGQGAEAPVEPAKGKTP